MKRGKKYPTELNIQQQIPLNVSMVSLLILNSCFVRCSCSRLIWSLYFFSLVSLIRIALCTQFSKYKMCNDPIWNRIPKQWCERDFHYACRCNSNSSNKTNGQSTYGNQVTSKNDLIPAPNCARKDHFLAATLHFQFQFRWSLLIQARALHVFDLSLDGLTWCLISFCFAFNVNAIFCSHLSSEHIRFGVAQFHIYSNTSSDIQTKFMYNKTKKMDKTM